MIRFWSKVEKTDTCWLWTASKNHNGYGIFDINGKTQRAHRLSYELYKGKIPDGLQIDHLCRVRHCVNPDHLEAVTRKENILRGICFSAINKRKTHCYKGHEFTKDNTYINPSGSRRCIICRNYNTQVWQGGVSHTKCFCKN